MFNCVCVIVVWSGTFNVSRLVAVLVVVGTFCICSIVVVVVTRIIDNHLTSWVPFYGIQLDNCLSG